MPSVAEVSELRRAGELLDLDHVDATLKTTAEMLAFLVTELRASGADEAEVLDAVELLAKAAQIDQQDLRSARATLKSLNYPPALISLLTKLARKAPAMKTYRLPGWPGDGTAAVHLPRQPVDHDDQVDRQALALLRRAKPDNRRR